MPTVNSKHFKITWLVLFIGAVVFGGTYVYFEATRGDRVVQQFIDACEERGGKLVISESARTFCVPVEYISTSRR